MKLWILIALSVRVAWPWAWALAFAMTGCKAAPAQGTDGAPLVFVRDGRVVRTLTRAEIEAKVVPETWTAFDPYYQRPKTFRALPLPETLALGFGAPAADLERLDFVLRAHDGYTVPLPGAKLFEKGGYIAVADVEVAAWEPIGPQRANPGPYYLVWREPSQQSLDTHPRPWQLARIEIAPFDATFRTRRRRGSPRTLRRGAASPSFARRAWRATPSTAREGASVRI
jgi:hypothetical protein